MGDLVGAELSCYTRPRFLLCQSSTLLILFLAKKLRLWVPDVEGPLRHKHVAFEAYGVGLVSILQDNNCVPYVAVHKVNTEVGLV